MRTRLAGLFAILALPILLGGISFKAEAQNADATVETSRFDDWILRCVKTETVSCRLSQQGYMEQNGKKVKVLTITADPERLRVGTPLGFDLTKGMMLRAGKFERVVAYRVCTKTGCAGGTPLDEELVRAFRKAENAEIILTSLEEQTVTMTVSLNGFTNAHREMMTAHQ